MAEIKTKPTAASVEDFINTVKDEQKRKDSFDMCLARLAMPGD